MYFRKVISIFTDKTFIKFILVGFVNTFVGTVIMLLFYNIFHFGYWLSSASNYFIGSIVSYLLNKHFTFHYKDKKNTSLIRFIINIIICYILAFGIAKPFTKWILISTSVTIQENVSMIIGMIMFVLFNYLGQRFFTFKSD